MPTTTKAAPVDEPADDADARLLRAAEVAELLGVTERTVRRWVASGALPVVRHGTSYTRFHRRDVDVFIARQRTGRANA